MYRLVYRSLQYIMQYRYADVMESSKRRSREPGVPSEALTVRLPVELTGWLREAAYTQRVSQALIIEEALTRYRESK